MEGEPVVRRVVVTSSEARTAPKQHTKPCSDCPWRRDSVAGWLGPLKPEEWVEAARSDIRVPCHVISNQQCAGAAIYRANTCKSPRDPGALKLPKDAKKVFSAITGSDFIEYHSRSLLQRASSEE